MESSIIKFKQVYEKIKEISSDEFSVVSLYKNKTTHEQFVVKQILNHQNICSYIEEEIKLNQKLMQSNATNLLIPKEIYNDNEEVILVLPYCDSGTLDQYIFKKKILSEDEARALFSQIIKGLSYIHKLNYIHRDLTTTNILLCKSADVNSVLNDSVYNVYICDFGISKFGGIGRTMLGNPNTIAPEVVKNNSNYSTKVDIWSVGILFYYCIFGEYPFSNAIALKNPENCVLKIAESRCLSLSALSLLEMMLQYNPEHRLCCEEVLEHQFFKDSYATYYLRGKAISLFSKSELSIDLTKREYTEKLHTAMLAHKENDCQIEHIINDIF